jgi:hypothetical protein
MKANNFMGAVERSSSTRRPPHVHAQFREAVLADHAAWLAQHEARAVRLAKAEPAHARATVQRTVGVIL